MKEEWKSAARERIQNMGIDEASASSQPEASDISQGSAESTTATALAGDAEEDVEAVPTATAEAIPGAAAAAMVGGSGSEAGGVAATEDTPQVYSKATLYQTSQSHYLYYD